MNTACRLLLLLLICSQWHSQAATRDLVARATVKISVVSASQDYQRPWTMHSPRRGTGSGCVIAGKRILTNAHVVANARYIQVQRYGDAKQYKAKVQHVIHDADLALLVVEDEQFFNGIQHLLFTTEKFPEPQSEVMVHGFPQGGLGLSITKGVVSRVESRTYAHSGLYLMAVQIDAPINPGNSGGPVTQDGRLIGVVMQGYRFSDGLGYMVPMAVINQVLKDLEDGKWDGFPQLGINVQHLENPHQKKFLGIPEGKTGIQIRNIKPNSSAVGHLQVGDVLLQVDGQSIADNGSIPFMTGRRIYFTHLVTSHHVGDVLDLVVFREGKEQTIRMPLTKTAHDTALVPFVGYEKTARYFIYGGLIFGQLTLDYLKTWGNEWRTKAPSSLVAKTRPNNRTDTVDEVVILQRVLPSQLNRGYHSWAGMQISKIDDVEVKNLVHVIELIEQGTSEFVTISDHRGYSIILPRAACKAETQTLMQQFRIPHDRSADLRQ